MQRCGELTRSADQLAIPATVQAILTARIDRLPEQQKDLLQTLSVIGTDFRLAVIRKLIGLPDQELERMLAALQLSEFIYEQPAPGDVEYIFKHALTRDVAYESVLNERRRLFHERTGGALESIYAESLDDHVAKLAYHYAHGGNPDKAVEYCLRSVRKFVYVGSLTEALARFHSGLELLRDLPDGDRRAETELDLRNAVFGAIGDAKGFASPEAEQSYARAMEICQRPGIYWEKTWVALFGSS